MTTKAKATKGTLIQRGDGGGSEVFTTIGEVTDFAGPGAEVSEIDVTSFDSAAPEYISDGLAAGGDITFEMNFIGNDAQQQGLRTDCQNGTLRNFKVVLNDHATTKTTFSVAAIVKKFDGPKGGQKQAYKASITLRVSGLPSISYSP
jgi:hypothetical protein